MLWQNMKYFFSIGLFAAAVLLSVSAVSGCGTSGDDSGEVSVKTGSLSKAEFISRADAICTAARSEFNRQYLAFIQKHKPPASTAGQIDWLDEIVETTFLPSYEPRIEQIGALGAPDADAEDVSAFLNALSERLDEIKEKPTELTDSLHPLAKLVKLANAYGLTGCVKSFS
jgi:hypothetical protein